jgi:hypothetical protein
MRVHGFQFSARLGAALLSVAGIGAAAAAHADAATDLAAPIKTSWLGSMQQCSDDKAGQSTLRFPVGTTFVRTDAGLMVVNQPTAAKSWEPEWPNTGN